MMDEESDSLGRVRAAAENGSLCLPVFESFIPGVPATVRAKWVVVVDSVRVVIDVITEHQEHEALRLKAYSFSVPELLAKEEKQRKEEHDSLQRLIEDF